MPDNNFLAWLDWKSFEADLIFQAQKTHWEETEGLAKQGQINFIWNLIDQCTMSDEELNKYKVELNCINKERASEIINQLMERSNFETSLQNPNKQIKFIFAQKSLV